MKYPLKVWLLTIVATPFALFVNMSIYNKGEISDLSSMFPFVFFMILFGTLFSLPSLFLFWLLSDELYDRAISNWTKKLILCLAGMLCVWISFFLINRDLFSNGNFNDYLWPILYSFVLTVFTVVLRMPGSTIEQGKFNERSIP